VPPPDLIRWLAVSPPGLDGVLWPLESETGSEELPVVFSLLFARFPKLSPEEILMIAGLPLQELRHTRAVQEILEEGRQEGREEGLEVGRQQEAAALVIRQLSRRFGTLDEGSRELHSSLPLQQLEQLAEDLLDFTEPADLHAWFDDHPAG
jgi:predicted transposase YdaD